MHNRLGSARLVPPVRLLALALAASWPALPSHAAGEVTEIETRTVAATPFDYTVDGRTYEWGRGTNLVLEAVVVDGERFEPMPASARVTVRRVDIAGVATGRPCGLFAERLGDGNTPLGPDFPALAGGGGNCDTEAILAASFLNRGALDLFSNQPPTAKNIERLDLLFPTALNAPFDAGAGTRAGHLVGDKSGNNPVQIAAVLALDADGAPADYGAPVRVGAAGCADPALCYGLVGRTLPYTFLQSESLAPQRPPRPLATFTEPVGLAFVSTEALGLAPGQRYHGVSLFATDVDAAVHDLTDPATFPSDTVDRTRGVPGDSVDLYGGSARYFVERPETAARGQVACDAEGEEPARGVPGVELILHVDADGDGVLDPSRDPPQGDPVTSGIDGLFELVGLPDGDYLLVLDTDSAGFPAGATVSSVDPLPVLVAGGNVASALDVTLDCRDVEGLLAVDDVRRVQQGAIGEIRGGTPVDVLANDIGTPRENLRVVEIGGAGQERVVIADDGRSVVYTPAVLAEGEAPGGEDSFTYVFADGAGTRSNEATVSIILDPPVSDPTCFNEPPPNPENCILLTEVDGHGFGGIRAATLLALLAALVARAGLARRRRATGART